VNLANRDRRERAERQARDLAISADYLMNWSSPLSLALVFAMVLAAMVTVLSYGFLAFTGTGCVVTRTTRAPFTPKTWTGPPG